MEERWSRRDLVLNKANVFIGFPLGGLLSLALMGLAATVFQPAGIGPDHLGTVALPVSLALGKLGLALVIIGFFAATFGAALETGLSAGYAVSQYFGWPWARLGFSPGHVSGPAIVRRLCQLGGTPDEIPWDQVVRIDHDQIVVRAAAGSAPGDNG